jgi:hypothetical protein
MENQKENDVFLDHEDPALIAFIHYDPAFRQSKTFI